MLEDMGEEVVDRAALPFVIALWAASKDASDRDWPGVGAGLGHSRKCARDVKRNGRPYIRTFSEKKGTRAFACPNLQQC
jgi:hypothetical protein